MMGTQQNLELGCYLKHSTAEVLPRTLKPMRGWFGVYDGDDFYPSVFNQSVNETVWDTYRFGRATLDNAASGSTGPVDGWKKPYSWHPAGATDGRAGFGARERTRNPTWPR